MSSNLSDVLRDLARDAPRSGADRAEHDEAASSSPAEAGRADGATVGSADPLGAADDEGGDMLGASPLSRAAQPRHRHGAPPSRPKADHRLRAIAVPVLLTVGLLLWGVGTWGVAVLAGMEVALSDKPDAESMARAMALVSFPLGLALFAGAGYFIYQMWRGR